MPGPVVGVFDTRDEAQQAVDLLQGAGFAPEALSLRSGRARPLESETPVEYDWEISTEPTTGAVAGAFIGGAIGATLGGPAGLAAGAVAGGAAGAYAGKQVQDDTAIDQHTSAPDDWVADRYLVVVDVGDREADARVQLTQANGTLVPFERVKGLAPPPPQANEPDSDHGRAV